MPRSEVHFHTVMLGQNGPALIENHRAHCATLGYAHIVHALTSGDNSHRTCLLYKFSLMHRLLSQASADTVLVVADDSAAIYADLDARLLLGSGGYWLAHNPEFNRPDGCLVILRAGHPQAMELVEQALLRLRAVTENGADRWAHLELEGLRSHPYEQLISGRHYPCLLFTNHVHNLPQVSAYLVSLNPTTHANLYDGRIARIFLAHLNECKNHATPVFHHPGDASGERPASEVINPGRPVALITSYTPNIASYARISEDNLSTYCRRHGYTHYVYRQPPAQLGEGVAGNWIKAALCLHHLPDHEQVGWVDADILIHDLSQALEGIVRGRSVTLARDVGGHDFNSGFMVFARDATARAFLELVQSEINNIQDKSGVYASGGDQSIFNEAWRKLGGVATMPVTDCLTLNSHPALHDGSNFMLHYMGYSDRMRELAMRHDAREIASRHP